MFTDYPANVDGRATQTGFQFRTGSWGNLNVDPVTGNVYAVWTDNRDGAHDVANPVTRHERVPCRSRATTAPRGASRSASRRGATRQVVPVGRGPRRQGGVVYQEESAGTGPYVTDLATSTNDGASWATRPSRTPSPTPNHSVWFQAHAPDCDTCSTFIGDYIGLAFDSLGRAHMTWTDMRRDIAVPQLDRVGKAQDAEYARR